jgi:transcriptional regulator with XRE-family HTH domain
MTPPTAFQPVTTNVVPRPAQLNELTRPVDTVRFVHRDIHLTQKEIARLLGSDERTVRRWLADEDGGNPQQRFARRIDDLRDLVRLLYETLPGEQTARWLRARNRLLKSGRPIDLLAQGRYAEVREAAEAYVDGDPI